MPGALQSRAASLITVTGMGYRVMRTNPANWVIATLLMLQLAIGMPWQVVHAGTAPPERQMTGVEEGHCPGHQTNDSRMNEGTAAGASTGAPSLLANPVSKHDCCRSSGCQCHSAQSPGVLSLPQTSAAFSAWLLLPVFDARPPVARTSEFFRPPIA